MEKSSLLHASSELYHVVNIINSHRSRSVFTDEKQPSGPSATRAVQYICATRTVQYIFLAFT